MKKHAVSDANSPGTASQGVEHWPLDQRFIEAVTDIVWGQSGQTVTVFPLENDRDVGEPLSIVFVNVRDPIHGELVVDGDEVNFTINPEYIDLEFGEWLTITLDYQITDGTNFADGFIQVRVEKPPFVWWDEDATTITDQDGAFIWVDPFAATYAWIDQDLSALWSEDETYILSFE